MRGIAMRHTVGSGFIRAERERQGKHDAQLEAARLVQHCTAKGRQIAAPMEELEASKRDLTHCKAELGFFSD
jgi:hypothetical protein